jgi:hypothetical protein
MEELVKEGFERSWFGMIFQQQISNILQPVKIKKARAPLLSLRRKPYELDKKPGLYIKFPMN